MKKWIIRGVVGVVVLVVVIVVVAVVWINQIAKWGIEYGGSRAMGVTTSVDSVRVGILRGQATVSGLDVANPQGFSSADFFRLGRADAEVSLGSLAGDTVEIPQVQLANVELSLEKNKEGQANYQVIMGNMKKQETTTQPPAGQKAGKKFVIRKLTIHGVKVRAQMPLLNTPVTLDITEPIVLENVGSGGAATTADIAGVVVKATLASTFAKGKGILPGEIMDGLGQGLQGLQSLASQGIAVAGDLGKEIGNLGGEATKMLGEADKVGGDVGKAMGDAGKGLAEGLGGLLGGGDKGKKK